MEEEILDSWKRFHLSELEKSSGVVDHQFYVRHILTIYEALHSLTHWLYGRHRYMAIKVDMSKVYNRIEWIFLQVVLSQMGFHLQWINLIITCVTSIFYSLLINGKAQLVFKPTRGIR